MSKIALKHKESGKVSSFEPVDAREILANPDSAYELLAVESAAESYKAAPVATDGGSLAGSAVDSSTWTKAQMHEHLTQQGVPLRSDMNKGELAELMAQHPVKKVW